MEQLQSVKQGILKKESVGYLKSKFNLKQATLIMTDERISLEVDKIAAGNMGILGGLLRNRNEKATTVFDIKYWAIMSIAKGKHGLQENVLEITDLENTHRILVKNYEEWEDAIKQKI